MKRSMLVVGLLIAVYALCVGVSPSLAQSYPNRTIQMIIPNVAGSIMDITGRLLAD